MIIFAGGKGGLKANKEEMLQPRNGSSCVGMMNPGPRPDGPWADQSPAYMWGGQPITV